MAVRHRQTDRLFKEAAAWFVRMRGPNADASRADFEEWLARGPSHRAAYNRTAEIFALGKHLADDAEIAAMGPKAPSSR